jgi:hypothetical protein
MFNNRMKDRFLASTKGAENRNHPMTIDAIRAAAPSAFAETKHDSRSDRFTYIPTAAVIDGLMKEGYQPFAAVQGRSRIEGKENFTKHLIRFRHPDAVTQMVRDSVPEIVVMNAHDGTSSYKLFGGVFRIVCTNGMIVSDSTIGSITIPHKGDIVQQVVVKSFEIIDQTKAITGRIDEWSQLQLTNGEQNALAESAHAMRFADAEGKITTPITPTQLLNVRREEDRRADLWTVFNRVQENVMRGGIEGVATDRNGRQVHRSTRGINGIDENVKLNRALWLLSERMAELKRGVAA